MSAELIKVLVTAAGGDLGQAIIKALRLCDVPIEIQGCDLSDTGIGSAFVDLYHVVPPANDQENYTYHLNRICSDHSIDAVIPASEVEIDTLGGLDSYPKLQCGTAIVCQNNSWVDIYGDKLNCMRSLEGKIALASFADGSDQEAVDMLVENVGFPIVVKSRRSSGSRSLYIVDNYSKLKSKLMVTKLPIIQQYIESTGGEFSVGVYEGIGFRSTIPFKRELGPVGCSWFAETTEDVEVLDYVEKIVDLIQLKGSVNIQVRKSDEGVRLLEINPRFSSLVAARAFCGFKDAEWSVLDALGMRVHEPASKYKHIRFRRFFHELVDEGYGFGEVPQWQPSILPDNRKDGG